MNSRQQQKQEQRRQWTRVTRCGNTMWPNFSKNCPKSSQSSFDLKINIALKINQIFGLLLYCYLSPRTFKNRPIRSHWGSRIKAKLTIEFSLKMSELQSADAMPVLCYANGFLSFSHSEGKLAGASK